MLTKICSVDLITGFGISLPQHEKVRHCRSVSGVTGQSNVDNVDSRLLKIVSSIADGSQVVCIFAKNDSNTPLLKWNFNSGQLHFARNIELK